MKGIVVINPFGMVVQSIHQAERLKTEFCKLGVDVEVVTDGYLRVMLKDGAFVSTFGDLDFAVYLDKDKYLSQILESKGVRLFNSHNAIRVCDDKAETYIALSGKGFNLPDTMFGALCYSPECKIQDNAVQTIEQHFGYPVIVKQCYGSLGKGVFLAENREQLKELMEKVKTTPHLFQEYLSVRKGVDVRVIVVGGKVVAHMERRNDNDFRSNVARGGSGVNVQVPNSFIETAESIARELKLDYCGIDLLYGADGQPVVCEVNSNAFFDGIESVTGVNVARIYAEYVINEINKTKTK